MKSAKDVVHQDLEHIVKNLRDALPLLEGKKMLITGGAGFLGHYLVQAILHWNSQIDDQRRIDVTIYDNFIRGLPDWLKALQTAENLTIVRHDITHPLPSDIGDFQSIIHAASIASPTFYRKYPIETMNANVDGLRYLLEYCVRQKDKTMPVESFLFYSSSEVYGDPLPEHIPTIETYNGNVSFTGPRACYDESKRYGETLCVNYAARHNLPVKIARPFNNYGPGLKITDRRVIPDFVRDILNNQDIIMLSDGSPTRTFCYIADAIVGYYKILTLGKPGEAYNIGTEEPEVSMADLAKRLVKMASELFGYSGSVVHKTSSQIDYLVDNPNRRCPQIGKAREDLGYEPEIDLDEGLRRSLIWYADNRQAEEA